MEICYTTASVNSMLLYLSNLEQTSMQFGT